MTQLYERIRASRDAMINHLPNVTDPDERRRSEAFIAEQNADLNHLDVAAMNTSGAPSTREQENRALGLPFGEPADGAIALRSDQRVTDWALRNHQVPTDHVRNGTPALNFGKYVRGMVTGQWQDSDAERRAMSEGTLTAGGYAVPTVLSASLIDLARPQARVLQAGAQVVPMAGSTVDVVKWTGDPTAAWHSENVAITPSDATLGRLRLTAKTLPSIVVVSRELLEDSDPVSIDAQLRLAFASAFALTIDRVALYGTGVAPEPLGLKLTSGVTSTPIATNGAALTNYDSIVDAVFRARSANEEPNGMIYASRTGKALGTLKDTTNQPLVAPPYLDGVNRFESNQIPTNLVVGTSGTTTSDVFVGDWSQMYVGVRTDLSVQVLTEKYADFGQIGFSAWGRYDIAVARPAAFQIVSGVQ